jgi:predicted kinase
MPTLYLVCGKIGSGKSTLARKLAEHPATLLISEDHWNSTLWPDELKTIDDYARLSTRLRAAMKPHIVALLQQDLSVVLDFAANTAKQRAWARSVIEMAQVPHELHVLDVPDAVCLQRLRARNASGAHEFHVTDAEFEQFTRFYAPPSPDEGFNVVTHRAGLTYSKL